MSNLDWSEEETDRTPGIVWDSEKNLLSMEGKLIPEDPEYFFDAFYDWLNRFLTSPIETVELDLYLYYYNTSSLKRLTIFFDKLEKTLNRSPKHIKINWKCDAADEDNIADGEDFKSMFDLDFKIVAVPDGV